MARERLQRGGDSWRNKATTLGGAEAEVYIGEPTPAGNRYVTKIMRQLPQYVPPYADCLGRGEVVSRLLLMQGISNYDNPNPDIARIRFFSATIESKGAAIFVIQDYVEGHPTNKFELSKRTLWYFGDLQGRNVIEIPKGFKVIDAYLNAGTFIVQKEGMRCSSTGRCDCDWAAFAERTRGASGACRGITRCRGV